MIIDPGTVNKATLILLIFLSGCATRYQEHRWHRGGYEDAQYDYNVFRVSFKSNGLTSKERNADLALLRSAELCRNSGYKYFIILEEDKYTKKRKHYSGSSSKTKYKEDDNGNATVTTKSGGGLIFTIKEPRVNLLIECHSTRPEKFSYDADFLYNSLRLKYKIDR